MTRAVTLTVPGHPATQGSKKAIVKGKRAVLLEMDAKLPDWREAITAATREITAAPGWEPLDGALKAEATFYLPRPKRPMFDSPATPPDLDKLQRALGDGLTLAGVIHDDARITRWEAEKTYATNTLGCIVTLTERTPNHG